MNDWVASLLPNLPTARRGGLGSGCLAVSACAVMGMPSGRRAFFIDPSAGQSELNHGKGHDDDEQHPRNGRGIAHLEVLEPVAVQVQHQEQRGVLGAAPGHDEGRREYLEAGLLFQCYTPKHHPPHMLRLQPLFTTLHQSSTLLMLLLPFHLHPSVMDWICVCILWLFIYLCMYLVIHIVWLF